MHYTCPQTPQQQLLEAAHLCLKQQQAAVIVTVKKHQGSVPRNSGANMLVTAHTTVATIGGGHLEYMAIREARLQLAQPHLASTNLSPANLSPTNLASPSSAKSIECEYILGASLGQCCGGRVTLEYTALDSESVGRLSPFKPLFFLQIYGAGHVGQAIVRLLATIDCQVQWIDEREEMLVAQTLPPHITAVAAAEEAVSTAPPQAAYVILTHSHDLDFKICEAVLGRDDFVYCGLIGSRTKRQRFSSRLQARGMAVEKLSRLTCPIGIAGINGKEPAEIAIAVVAQLLQVAGAQKRVVDNNV